MEQLLWSTSWNAAVWPASPAGMLTGMVASPPTSKLETAITMGLCSDTVVPGQPGAGELPGGVVRGRLATRSGC